MGVTSIIRVQNASDFRVQFQNQQSPTKKGNFGTVWPGKVFECEMWVPWCTNEADYMNGHYISLTLHDDLGPRHYFQIWQAAGPDGDFVRLRPIRGDGSEHFGPARPIAGISRVDGERGLLVDKHVISLWA